MRHVHADIIKAWLDGKEIQCRISCSDKWVRAFPLNADGTLCFLTEREYRIKPEGVKYRRWLYKDVAGKPRIAVLNYECGLTLPEDVEQHEKFIRWIDNDWQEVEI